MSEFFTNCLSSDSPLVMKVRSRAGSVMSGASTPGGGAFKSLSEGDLKKADEALSHVNGIDGGP
jgi:glycogen synthase